MKKLLTITAIFCLTALAAVVAKEPNDVKKSNIKAALITLPAMNWGSADEVDAKDIETLKVNSVRVDLPDMNWGSPEELKEVASIAIPDMNWGTHEEVDAEF